MPDLNLPIGVPLKDWKIQEWFELRVSTSETSSEVAGYYLDQELAKIHGQGKGWGGSNGTVSSVFVLTNDCKTGYLLSIEVVQLTSEAKATREIFDQLPDDKKYLGIE